MHAGPPPGAHETDATLSRRSAWAIALVATFTMAVSYVDRQTLSVLAPTVTRALGVSDAGYGWLASAFSIAYLAGAPLAGRVIDRLGARRGLFGALLVWSTVAALHALAPGFLALFALRIALGLAEAPSFPGAVQTIHRALPPSERARGFGVLFTGSSIGAMIAPPVATLLNARWGWRVAFLGSAVVGLVWIPLWRAVAFGAAARRALDVAPAPIAGEERPRWRAVLLDPAVVRAVVVVIAGAPVVGFALLWGAKYLVGEYGLGQTAVGGYLWLPPLFFDLGSVYFGDAASRRARRRPPGAPDRPLVATAMAMAMVMLALPLAPTAWDAMLLTGVAMAGAAGLFAITTGDLMGRIPPAAAASAGGLLSAAQSLAYIVSTPLVGHAVEHLGGYAWPTLAIGAWVLPGCAVWLAWRPRAPSRPA
jgi:ACS family hexuronate transporter-like MFS transporter